MTPKEPFLEGTFWGQLLAAPSLPGVFCLLPRKVLCMILWAHSLWERKCMNNDSRRIPRQSTGLSCLCVFVSRWLSASELRVVFPLTEPRKPLGRKTLKNMEKLHNSPPRSKPPKKGKKLPKNYKKYSENTFFVIFR